MRNINESYSFKDDYFFQESDDIDRIKSKIAECSEEITELEAMLKKNPNNVTKEILLEDAKKRMKRWKNELEELDEDMVKPTNDPVFKPNIRYDASTGMNIFTINKKPQNESEFNKIYEICKKMKNAVDNKQWSSFESNASVFYKEINISDYESRRMMLNTIDKNCVQIWFTNAETKVNPTNMRFFHCSHTSSHVELKPTHVNAANTIIYPCNAVFFIAINKSDNIDKILSNFKMYGENVYEYIPSRDDIIYTDSKERRENRIPAVFIKTNKPLKVNKYQIKTSLESYSFDNINDDYFSESVYSFDKTIDVCKELHRCWSKFDYGIPINGRIQSVRSAKEFYDKYRFLSPEDFEKYGGGICCDFVEWGAKFLRDKGVSFHQYYIQTDTPPNYDAHTFIVCKCGDKFVYPEYASGTIDKDINGVGVFNSLPEIYNYIASMMFKSNGNNRRFNNMKFTVKEFTQTPNYGCTNQEYMDFINKYSHLIFKGNITNNKIITESKLSTTKRDALKDSDFGIPEKRAYPLNDKNHVEAAVRMFPHADDSDKEELAKRILRKAHHFGMDTSKWDLNKYIQEDAFEPIHLDEIVYATASSGYKPEVPDESQINPFVSFDKVPLNDFIINRYKPKTDDFSIGLKHLHINDNSKGFLWLNQKDDVVGYVCVDYPNITIIELSPNYQHKGLGRKLLDFATDYLGGRKLCVSKCNDNAIKMFKHCGWSVYDESSNMYLMEKNDDQESHDIYLRSATEEDIPNMIKWKIESIDKSIQNDPKTIGFIKGKVNDLINETQMIMDNDQTIGMLTAYDVDGYWYIDEIYLIEEYRGNGIGTNILKDEISQHDKLSLKVAKDNLRAFELYKSLGFKAVDQNEFTYHMILDKNNEESESNEI